MGASNGFANSLLLLFFNATAWANIAQNNGTSPATTLYYGLHTASAGAGGNQTTNEIGYTGYARVGKTRDNTGFTVTGGTCNPAANVDFPAGTGGSGTATDMSLGLAASSTGTLELFGSISPSIVTGNGVTPRLTTSTAFTVS